MLTNNTVMRLLNIKSENKDSEQNKWWEMGVNLTINDDQRV